LFPADPADAGYNEEAAAEGETAAAEENEKVLAFFRNADILIHDAQYTETELASHLGWGHSSCEQAIAAASSAGVKKLILFHHDPSRTDAQLAELEQHYRAQQKDALPRISMAREGLVETID
jgi:ribonuclease BN (tRNA processing enzyme)